MLSDNDRRALTAFVLFLRLEEAERLERRRAADNARPLWKKTLSRVGCRVRSLGAAMIRAAA